jgi:uncharacterized damage-inducible protein DinB
MPRNAIVFVDLDQTAQSMPGGMLTDAIKLDWQPPIGAKRRLHRETTRMITPAYVRLMAHYNAEMNRRLYAAAARLTEAERKADRGAFWQSIHGTLTHNLWGDTQWMSRFDAWPKPEVGQKQSAGMVDDFAVLQTRRTKADADIIAWANRVDDAWLAEDLVWFSGSAGREMRRQKAPLMVHFFNHQTHHRGQAHALLTACHQDTGDTDLFLVVPDAA